MTGQTTDPTRPAAMLQGGTTQTGRVSLLSVVAGSSPARGRKHAGQRLDVAEENELLALMAILPLRRVTLRWTFGGGVPDTVRFARLMLGAAAPWTDRRSAP